MQTQLSSKQIQAQPYSVPQKCLHSKVAPQDSVECYIAMQSVSSPGPNVDVIVEREDGGESGPHGVESSLEFGGPLETSLEFRASEGTSLDFGAHALRDGMSPRRMSNRIDKGEHELEHQSGTDDEKTSPANDSETNRDVVNTHIH